ncbi:PTS sugar transporter subunit IIB [Lacticaseibacillus nasuensis]|uniref:PTS sugar transporter subunit IIB n=1 Tax=Lacticaseibacillus nasuensis TaxID=944671 RepID=UPI0022485014|nr:PTS sugar transporter subunit IIB [Lacticaseibacillus nasuensis]MCX2454487.1 PTS sugar transporter subunit IIB [Lacticaseibacillus nasuensis]
MTSIAIGLACNLGASTSILVGKMKQVVAGSQKLATTDVRIDAFSASSIDPEHNPYQVIMLAPQIAHREAEIKQKLATHPVPVTVINATDFGTMNAANILKTALREIKAAEAK